VRTLRTPSARPLLTAALAALLAGCAVGPDFVRPAMTLPAAYGEAPDWQPATPGDARARGSWWQVFNDPELDALEAKVEVSNQNLRAAVAKYDQAQALAAQSRAAYWPTVDASAGQKRGQSSNASGVQTVISAQATAAWELDLWGRIRRTVESSEATAQASLADLENVRLSLQAQLAQDYFLLRVADANIRLLDETVAAYAKSLELTRNRYAAGVVTRADVAAAETQLAAAQAQWVDAGIGRAQLEHAIAVLAGSAPSDLNVTARETLPTAQTVPQIPAYLPAQLLERRPDIAGAERRAAAANAQIGVAIAAFYPALSIDASGGFINTSWANLLSAPSRIWAIGPTLAATLFSGGARIAATDAARANFEQTAAQYRQTVLSALQEVEDNLVALRLLESEADLQAEAVRAARQTLDLTTNQYKAGTQSYLAVIVVQAALLNAQSTELNIRGRQLIANVTLIRALGGGWQAPTAWQR